MKNYFKYLSILCISLMFTSCLVDDDITSDLNDKGPNLLGFTSASFNATATADGNSYNFTLPIEVTGPTYKSITGDFTAIISVDPSSTAIEDVHFTLSTNTVNISSDDNLIGNFTFTVLTGAVQPPLEETPVLTLNISEISNGSILPNGRTASIDINLLYLCFSDLSGTYSVEMRYVNPDAGTDTMHFGTDVINQTGDGQYRTEAVGHWEIDGGPGAIGGTPGFDFVDVCNELTIPSQNLLELYSNIVEGVVGESSLDPETGIITFQYTVTADYARMYWATYTPL